MNLCLNADLAKRYKSRSQTARVMTEQWVSEWIFCPNCGQSHLRKYPNNKPVADFGCPVCDEDYELKSQRQAVTTKIVDGAYASLIERLQASSNPNLFLLQYDFTNLEVRNFLVIPKQFFVPGIVEQRKPLRQGARRAGWIGCNLLLNAIPQKGKIFFVQEKKVAAKDSILFQWSQTVFLKKFDAHRRGWLLDAIMCVERLGVRDFTLQDLYRFEDFLRERHPGNRHIREKMRQQLQVLRDMGYIEFMGRGRYRVT